jgi:hypothetical protein
VIDRLLHPSTLRHLEVPSAIYDARRPGNDEVYRASSANIYEAIACVVSYIGDQAGLTRSKPPHRMSSHVVATRYMLINAFQNKSIRWIPSSKRNNSPLSSKEHQQSGPKNEISRLDMSSHFGIILQAGAGARSRRVRGSEIWADGKANTTIEQRAKSRLNSESDESKSEAAKRPESVLRRSFPSSLSQSCCHG